MVRADFLVCRAKHVVTCSECESKGDVTGMLMWYVVECLRGENVLLGM